MSMTLPRLRLPRISPAVAAIIVGVLIVLGCGWLWFRDSSFVTIQRVRVSGLSGPDVGQIRAALVNSAETMTTLDVNMGALNHAVEAYPFVRALNVNTNFPHGLVIEVQEEIPVAIGSLDGRTLGLTGSGTLLRDLTRSAATLPTVSLSGAPPQDGRVQESATRAELRALGAAPFAMLAHVTSATYSSSHGVTLKLRGGPTLYFGAATELASKWAAAEAVLGDSQSQGSQYIDVSDPQHPAAGASGSATPQTPTTTTAGPG
jgi:cell division protein FtsQ